MTGMAEQGAQWPLEMVGSSDISLAGVDVALASICTEIQQLEADLTTTQYKLARLRNVTRKGRYRLLRQVGAHRRWLMQSAPAPQRSETALAEVILAAQEKARSMASDTKSSPRRCTSVG
jgi:hypothetical protein